MPIKPFVFFVPFVANFFFFCGWFSNQGTSQGNTNAKPQVMAASRIT